MADELTRAKRIKDISIRTLLVVGLIVGAAFGTAYLCREADKQNPNNQNYRTPTTQPYQTTTQPATQPYSR